MVVVKAISPLNTVAVRAWMSACRVVGSMSTADGAVAAGLFDWDILDEVINRFCSHSN